MFPLPTPTLPGLPTPFYPASSNRWAWPFPVGLAVRYPVRLVPHSSLDLQQRSRKIAQPLDTPLNRIRTVRRREVPSGALLEPRAHQHLPNNRTLNLQAPSPTPLHRNRASPSRDLSEGGSIGPSVLHGRAVAVQVARWPRPEPSAEQAWRGGGHTPRAAQALPAGESSPQRQLPQSAAAPRAWPRPSRVLRPASPRPLSLCCAPSRSLPWRASR